MVPKVHIHNSIIVSNYLQLRPCYHSDQTLTFFEGLEGEYGALNGQTFHCYNTGDFGGFWPPTSTKSFSVATTRDYELIVIL